MGFNSQHRGQDEQTAAPVVDEAVADSQEAARAQSDEINRAAVNDYLPPDVTLEEVGVRFSMPAGLVFADQTFAQMRTERPSQVNLSVDAEELVLWFSPGMHIDAMFPVENMTVYSVRWNFTTGQPSVDVRTARGSIIEGDGVIDRTADAEEAIIEKLSAGIDGTPAARPGYNPFADRDLQGTLGAIAANLQALPTEPAHENAPDADDMQRVGAHATLRLGSDFVHPGGLRVAGGGAFRVSIEGNGSVGDILGAQSTQGQAAAAQIRGVRVSSEAVFITHDGEDVAQLKSLWVQPGGEVSIQQMELMGAAAGYSGLEALLRIIGGAAALSQRGVGGQAALEMSARSPSANPTIVPGLTRSKIEEGLTEAVQQLLNENATAIPGVDLREVFGG